MKHVQMIHNKILADIFLILILFSSNKQSSLADD